MVRNVLKESKKIFSLRKLSVGLCSVALGTMLLVVQNISVKAAVTDQQQIVTIKSAETQTESNVIVQAKTTGQEEKMVDNKELEPRFAQEDNQIEAAITDQQWIETIKGTETQTESNVVIQAKTAGQEEETVNNKELGSQSVQEDKKVEAATKDQQQVTLNDDKRQESQSVLNDAAANKTDGSNALNTVKIQSSVQDNKKESSALGAEVAKKREGKTSIDSTVASINKTDELVISKTDKKVNLSQAAYQKHFNQWVIRNGRNYYYDAQGHQIRNQWAAPTGTLHYFGNEGYTIENQWYTMPDGNTYYFANDGHRVINRWYDMPDGNTYYFANDGHRVINRWYDMPDGNTYYFANDGHRVINRWYDMPDGHTYYFANDGHRVINRWYTMPDGNTYYFANDGQTVKNRWYTMPDGSTCYFDNDGHTIAKHSSRYDIRIDPSTMVLNVKTNAIGDIYVKDPQGAGVGYGIGGDGKFSLYVSRYSGEYITVEVKPYGSDASKGGFSETVYVPKLILSNISIDPSTTELNGKINGIGDVWIKDSNGKETFQCYANGKFNFDASQYSGEYITVEVKSEDGYSRVISSKTVYVFNNVSIDPSTTALSGQLKKNSAVWIKDSNGKEIFQCYTDNNGKFNFDASQYSGEDVTLEVKSDATSNSKVISSENIHVPKLTLNNVVVNADTAKLSGELNGTGAIWVKDFMGREKFQCYTNNRSFIFDAIQYSGQDITVEVKPNASSDSRVITSESVHVMTIPTFNSLSVDPDTRIVTGFINEQDPIWVKDANGKETCVLGEVSNYYFTFDASQYSGEYITVGIGDTRVHYSSPIYIPTITISNVSVNPDTTELSGKINGKATLWVESPDGSEKSYGYTSTIDASQYSGENITIKLRAGDTLDSRVISSKKVYIPSLKISDVRVDKDSVLNDLFLSGRVNGQADIYIKIPDGREIWEAFTDKGTYKFSIAVGHYEGNELVIEAKPAQGSRVITTNKVKIPLL